MTLGTIVGLAAGGCYYVGGLFAIQRYYRPETRAEIINPSHQSENGGRHITVSVNIPRRRRRAVYRIAIQPNDCRADGIWWPQNAPLSVNASGSASLPRVRLGRDGPQDVGKTFTVGLFEVFGNAQAIFSSFAYRDNATMLPSECRPLHSVEVRRV